MLVLGLGYGLDHYSRWGSSLGVRVVRITVPAQINQGFRTLLVYIFTSITMQSCGVYGRVVTVVIGIIVSVWG